MMKIHFHPRRYAKQEKEQRCVKQNQANSFFVVGFHHQVISNWIDDLAAQFKPPYLSDCSNV